MDAEITPAYAMAADRQATKSGKANAKNLQVFGIDTRSPIAFNPGNLQSLCDSQLKSIPENPHNRNTISQRKPIQIPSNQVSMV
jgi:hypothetical protein